MLKKLLVKNYALIESLEMEFKAGFSVITGETGAGKSILLGALSLILGSRADSSALKNLQKKCVIEGHYDIGAFGLQGFFEKEGLDYYDETILRREISPQGRSRAFINDSPVNLNLMKKLGDFLTDIHSQHHNLELRNHTFQLYALDVFAGLSGELQSYKKRYSILKSKEQELRKLKEAANAERSEQDYYQFRFEELQKAKLRVDEQAELEERHKFISHAAEIKQTYGTVFQELSSDDLNVNERLTHCIQALGGIENYLPEAGSYKERLTACRIELADVASDIEKFAEDVEYSPEEAEAVQIRLDLLYELQKKHKVNSVQELLDIQHDLESKIENISSFEKRIKDMQEEVSALAAQAENDAAHLSKKRKAVKSKLEEKIKDLLHRLGMPNALFELQITDKAAISESGKDDVAFLFSANKNVAPAEISSIASGGEISRLMLSLKAIIAGSVNLPTIIFDEIDTGVSGDIADKTGSIMQQMSKDLQVIDITHLPQIAAKADTHYVVYKTEENNTTRTQVKELRNQERVQEIAKMLSGENITEAAVKNARALIAGNAQ